jgi:aspartyl-tRNA(Asn)/glutamyl-tRNA(Gln) amidotransferase subunit C
MTIDRATVEHVARLARLALTDDDRERFLAQLGRILEHFSRLMELDPSGAAPMAHVLPAPNVLRDDVVTPSLDREEVLAQAPAHEAGFFKVPRVLEEA